MKRKSGSDTDLQLLQSIGARLFTDADPAALVDEVLSAALALTGAPMGLLYLRDDHEREAVRLRASRGLDEARLAPLRCVNLDRDDPCFAELIAGRRVVADDVARSALVDDLERRNLAAAGMAAVQCTPIMSRNDDLIGIITIAWPRIHRPSARVLQLMDVLARATGTALQNIELLASLRRELAERERAEAALRDSEERLRRALQAGEVFAYEWHRADDTLIGSENCSAILGFEGETGAITGRRWEERIHPEDRARYQEAMSALERGMGRQVVSYRYVRGDGSTVWIEETCIGEFDVAGNLVRVSGLVRDVTARKHVEELQQLLMREFNHRARNMLATIQAMISLTARSQKDIGAFVAEVQSRIRSMARAQELIADSRWTGARIRDIVSEELDPYTGERPEAMTLSGADAVLTPAATMALTMALHELATNAAKYGALSVPEGRVHVAVGRHAGGGVTLRWSETNGPPVAPPRRRGFGSLLIEGSIRSEIGGTAEVRYRRSGLVCTVEIPESHVVDGSATGEPDAAVRESPSAPATQRRILLVGDGALERRTRERLEDLGYEVVGPVQAVDDALRLAHDEALGAAILDINLGENDVFPVLDVLSTRNIPIAFVTGYRLISLPPQYRACQVLPTPLTGDDVRRVLESRFQGASPVT